MRTISPVHKKTLFIIHRTILIVLYIINLSIGTAQERDSSFVLSGRIEKSTTDTLRVIRDHQVDRTIVPVDSEGGFYHEISLKYPRFVFVQLPVRMGRKISLYAEPGDHISMVIRNGGLTNEFPHFEGDRMNENNLILGLDNLRDSLQQSAMGKLRTEFSRYLQSLSLDSMDALIKNIVQQLHEHIDIYAPSLQNPLFIRFVKKRVQWDMIDQKLTAILIHNNNRQKDPNFRPIPREEIQAVLDRIDLNDTDLLGYDRFKSLMFHILGLEVYNSFAQWQNDPGAFYTLYKKALEMKEPKIRDKTAFLLLTELIKMNPATRQVARFDSIQPDHHFVDLIRKWREFNGSQESGIKVPDFPFIKPSGDTFYLHQLKGKLLYIYFWATWCKPCIKEHPHLMKLKQEYKEENIEFVSISLDDRDKINLWREFLKRNDLKGVQLKAENGMGSAIRKWLKIKEIPVFTLIGTNGNLLQGFAPRPSSSEVRRFLDGFLID